jgi:hypothetical protein
MFQRLLDRYAEWDFSGVPDPVMFQRFLDVADYWLGCFDNSSPGSYDPTRECFVVVVGDHADNVSAVGAECTPRLTNRRCWHQRTAVPSALA